MNVNFEKNFYFGAAVEHDTKKVTSSAYSLVQKDGGNKYWFTYDATNSVIGSGCVIPYCEGKLTIASEGKWNHSDTARLQLWSQPLTLATGGRYVCSEDSSVFFGFEFAKYVSAQAKFDHKINKNLKVTIHQSYDCDRHATKRAPYDLGFNVAYTL